MHLLTKKLFNTNYNHTFVLLNNEVIKTLSINLKAEFNLQMQQNSD